MPALLTGLALWASMAAGQDNLGNDAAAFDKIARTLFKPIYPLLALQIKDDYGITKGVCVDAGSGPGYLAIELAKITDLEIHSLDIDPKASEIARGNVKDNGVEGKVKVVTADVQKMPFPENFAQLVISRGSYIFWPDKVRAFKEILRILKPGGTAFIGGGMGNLLQQDERRRIQDTMAEKNIGPPAELMVNLDEMGKILREAGIPEFKITTDEGCLCGLWVEFTKPALKSGDNGKIP
jgi:SAM-dependent methyltransferase